MSRDRKEIKPDPVIEVCEFMIKARDDYDIRLRGYRQQGKSGLPLFQYMHGGGFVTGSLETDDRS